MPGFGTNSKISFALALFLSAPNAHADSIDSSTWYFPGAFIQSLSATRHIMEEEVTLGDLTERKRALVNEYDEPLVVQRPTDVAWTVGYSFAHIENPFGSLRTDLSSETQHSFHAGFIWQMLRDFNSTLIFRLDTVPMEDYRGGVIEMNFGNFELIRPPRRTKPEQDDLEDENLSNFARIARRQQRRDEETRRRQNERLMERPKPRVFTEESLFLRGHLAWSRHQLFKSTYRDAWAFHIGPQLFYLPEPTRTLRFSILWSAYNVPIGKDFYQNLDRPGPRAALAKPSTGYAELSSFLRGFPTFTFAGGATFDVSGPWLYDLGASLNTYNTGFVAGAFSATAYRELWKDFTLGLGGDFVASQALLGVFSLKLSYDL